MDKNNNRVKQKLIPRLGLFFSRRQLMIIITSLVVLVVAIIIVIIVLAWQHQTARQSLGDTVATSDEVGYTLKSQAVLGSGDEPDDLAQITYQYGNDYDVIASEVFSSNPADWDRAMLDKAYFVLVYADKIGDFSQAKNVLYRVEKAEVSGVDIDSNGLGIDQAKRSEINSRADALYEKAADRDGAE